MAWTAPMTAVDNTPFYAVEFNTHVRDNLLETAPAKATGEGNLFVSTGTNTISERVPSGAFVAAEQITNQTGYSELFSVGPNVTVETGSAALVILGCNMGNSLTNVSSYMSFTVGLFSASDQRAVGKTSQTVAEIRSSYSNYVWISGLTPGTNTFSARYRVTGGVGSFGNRSLIVLPL